MRLLRFGTSLFLTVALAYSQTALDNSTILKLVKAGIGDDTIIGMVNQQPGKYALSADDIIALKNAGVSEKIIVAMIVKGGASPAPIAPTATTTVAPAPQIVPQTPPAEARRKHISLFGGICHETEIGRRDRRERDSTYWHFVG